MTEEGTFRAVPEGLSGVTVRQLRVEERLAQPACLHFVSGFQVTPPGRPTELPRLKSPDRGARSPAEKLRAAR